MGYKQLLPCLVMTICASPMGRAETEVSYRDVAVVVNTNSTQSVAIGAYFMNARAIPAINIINVAADTTEEIDSTGFNDLRSQIENHLVANNIVDSINYIVTTKGVPLKVNRGNAFSTQSPSASIESELTLILGPYASFVGRQGRLFHPYFQQRAHFSRAQYGVYLVTRLDAFTQQQAFALIDRSGPGIISGASARFVFDQDPDWNASMPSLNDSMAAAANSLASRGKTIDLDQTATYLTGRSSVLGYMSWGSNDHHATNYTQYGIPHNSWVPGSIAETYVSYSGRSFAAPPNYGQSLIADLIQEGVCGAKGYVYEPFASSMALATVLFDRYTTGYNLAESFYCASRYMSWMDLVIGDPKTSVSAQESQLPVQLEYVTATYIGASATVDVRWRTVSEVNNHGFYVQRRGPGESGFADILGSFQPGQGTTLEPHQYAWLHRNVSQGSFFYRLKQVDNCGDVHYSDPILMTSSPTSLVREGTIPTELALKQNYPNPFNPSTKIEFELPSETRVSLRVYSTLGAQVATLHEGVLPPGVHRIDFAAGRVTGDGARSALPSGVYFYTVETDKRTLMRKMILAK